MTSLIVLKARRESDFQEMRMSLALLAFPDPVRILEGRLECVTCYCLCAVPLEWIVVWMHYH